MIRLQNVSRKLRKTSHPLILAGLSDKTSSQQQDYRIEKRRMKRGDKLYSAAQSL
jgi:hypothetical protein